MKVTIVKTKNKYFKRGFDTLNESKEIIVESFEEKEWAIDWAKENGYTL